MDEQHIHNEKPVQGQNIASIQQITQIFNGPQDTMTSSTKPQRIWNVPHPYNRFFTGRKELLSRLQKQLRKGQKAALSQPQAISGLGGIGKTQIAVEYAHKHRQKYQAILWARAESHEALTSSFVEIARLLDLPQKDEQDQTMIVQAVKRWLQENSGWLLILDNADEPKVVREFLPTKSAGHILLTTRAQALGGLAQRIEVDTFTPELGALFLLRRATIIDADGTLDDAMQSDRDIAMQISEELGGLPLALDQAGAYIEETSCSLADYLDLYRTRRAEVLKERGGLTDDHPDSVATTWSISFEKVEQANPAAADLLRLCAFLAPDAIPEEIISAGAEHLGPLLRTAARDPMILNKATAALGAYSLISRNATEKILSIHRLVQAVLRDALPDDEGKLWAERTVLAVSKACPDVVFAMWQQWERYLPHALACGDLVEQEKLLLPETFRLLNETGNYLCERARYTEAKKLYQQCLHVWKQDQEHEHLDVAYFLRGLGNVYSELSEYSQANDLYQRSLSIFEQHLGYNDPDVARCLNNLAILCKVQGNYKKAEQLYQRSLDIWEQSWGPEHPNVAQSLNNLAVLYAEQGKYEKAKELFERSRNIREQKLGPQHPDVAQSLSNLANVYTEQGKYEKAKELFEHSQHIRKQELGSQHPDIAYSFNGLAILHQRKGEYTKAEELFRQSLHIWKQGLNPDHPQVAYCLNNQAILSVKQDQYWEAEPLFKQSLDIFEQKLGPQHPHTLACEKNYASLLDTLFFLPIKSVLPPQRIFSVNAVNDPTAKKLSLRFINGTILLDQRDKGESDLDI